MNKKFKQFELNIIDGKFYITKDYYKYKKGDQADLEDH